MIPLTLHPNHKRPYSSDCNVMKSPIGHRHATSRFSSPASPNPPNSSDKYKAPTRPASIGKQQVRCILPEHGLYGESGNIQAQRLLSLWLRYSPEKDPSVAITSNCHLPIEGEGHALHRIGVALQGDQGAATAALPQSRRLIPGPGEELAPIGGAGHAPHHVGVAL